MEAAIAAAKCTGTTGGGMWVTYQNRVTHNPQYHDAEWQPASVEMLVDGTLPSYDDFSLPSVIHDNVESTTSDMSPVEQCRVQGVRGEQHPKGAWGGHFQLIVRKISRCGQEVERIEVYFYLQFAVADELSVLIWQCSSLDIVMDVIERCSPIFEAELRHVRRCAIVNACSNFFML